MSVIYLNQESAIVGFILATIKEERPIKVDDVINFCNFLNTGGKYLLLNDFNTNSLKRLFESKPKIFKKSIRENTYIISIERCQKTNDLRKFLIEEFEPNLNYPRSILEKMKLL